MFHSADVSQFLKVKGLKEKLDSAGIEGAGTEEMLSAITGNPSSVYGGIASSKLDEAFERLKTLKVISLYLISKCYVISIFVFSPSLFF